MMQCLRKHQLILQSFSFLRVTFLFLVSLEFADSQTEQCNTARSACILPQPLKSHGGKNLDSLWLEMRCTLGCIEEYGGVLSLLDRQSPWPTLNFNAFESNCAVYQKVQECTKGCVQRHSDPYGSINRCRDRCYASCKEQRRNCNQSPSCEDIPCHRSCRKTYCRFGCQVYDNTFGANGGNFIRYPAPPHPNVSLPVLPLMNTTNTQGGSGRNWLYTINTRQALISSTQNISQSRHGTVAFSIIGLVLKVSTSNGVHYYWQKNSSQAVDLSPYACSTVSISFGVLSKYGKYSGQQLQFSPPTTVCIPGVGGYPDQVVAETIRVTYTEDTRQEYFSYSIGYMTWSKPNNSQFLTSYTIRVYPNAVRCGGTTDVAYKYQNINKDLTSFSFQAKNNNGLWRFGCSYLIEIISLPTARPITTTIGSYISSSTELRTGYTDLNLDCSRVWYRNGTFSVSVSWTLAPSSHIYRFRLTPKLMTRGSRLVQHFNTSYLQPVDNHQTNFSFLTQVLQPQADPSYKFIVEVGVEKNHLYYWRNIPHTQFCVVSADSLRPSTIRDVAVTDISFNRTDGTLGLRIEITPPEVYGVLLSMYEVLLGDQTFLSASPQVEIYTDLEVNDSDHCILLSVRAFNEHNISGNWSQPLLVPLDEECSVASINDSFISIFYGQTGREKIKILEIACGSHTPSDSGSIEGKIQSIDKKLQNMILRLPNSSQEEEKLSQMERKLQTVEEKLDHILEMLGRQSHQGT